MSWKSWGVIIAVLAGAAFLISRNIVPRAVFVIPDGIEDWVAVYHDPEHGTAPRPSKRGPVFRFDSDGTLGLRDREDVTLVRTLVLARRESGDAVNIEYVGHYSGPDGLIVFYVIGDDLMTVHAPVTDSIEILKRKLVDRADWHREE